MASQDHYPLAGFTLVFNTLLHLPGFGAVAKALSGLTAHLRCGVLASKHLYGFLGDTAQGWVSVLVQVDMLSALGQCTYHSQAVQVVPPPQQQF